MTTAEDFEQGRVKCSKCRCNAWRKHGFDPYGKQVWECKYCEARRTAGGRSRPHGPELNPMCPRCPGSTRVVMHSRKRKRWLCRACNRTFGKLGARKHCKFCYEMITFDELRQHLASCPKRRRGSRRQIRKAHLGRFVPGTPGDSSVTLLYRKPFVKPA